MKAVFLDHQPLQLEAAVQQDLIALAQRLGARGRDNGSERGSGHGQTSRERLPARRTTNGDTQHFHPRDRSSAEYMDGRGNRG
jgi:hypothetical protein